MSIKIMLFSLASLFALPAFAHVSHSSAEMHLVEHLLLVLAFLPVIWLIKPAKRMVEKIKSHSYYLK